MAQRLARLEDFPVGTEHGDAAQPDLHELERHEPVVDAAELNASELDHVDLDPTRTQAIEQALHQRLGLVVLKERAVEQVDADDPERLLLHRRFDVEHPEVEDDLARLITGMGLELHPHPPVTLVAPLVAAGHHGVGEREERGGVAAQVAEPVEVEAVLVIEHRLEPRRRHVTVGLAVHGVAHCHVVCRHRLGDGPRRAPDTKEPPDDLLPGPDLRHRPVPTGIEVYPERLLVGVDRLRRCEHVRHGRCQPPRRQTCRPHTSQATRHSLTGRAVTRQQYQIRADLGVTCA